MKVTVEIEQDDYVKAITPFRNGCSFRARFWKNGKVLLEPGCYLLKNLIQGAERWMYEEWINNNKKPFKIAVTPETILKMKKIHPCRHCGGSMFVAPTEEPKQ